MTRTRREVTGATGACGVPGGQRKKTPPPRRGRPVRRANCPAGVTESPSQRSLWPGPPGVTVVTGVTGAAASGRPRGDRTYGCRPCRTGPHARPGPDGSHGVYGVRRRNRAAPPVGDSSEINATLVPHLGGRRTCYLQEDSVLRLDARPGHQVHADRESGRGANNDPYGAGDDDRRRWRHGPPIEAYKTPTTHRPQRILHARVEARPTPTT